MRNKIFRNSIVLFGCAVLVGCETVSQPTTKTASAETSYTGSYVKRPTLVVQDIDKSVILFRDILGFKMSRFDEDARDSYVYPAFKIPVGSKVMHATFDTDVEKRVISIVGVKSMQIRPDIGLRTSTVLINANGRLDDILGMLKNKGYKILPKHPLGKTGTEVGFLDSNGHLIVLYEFPKP